MAGLNSWRLTRQQPLAALSHGFLFAGLHWSLLFLVMAVTAWTVVAQTDPPSARPYASLDRNAVSYRGPGRGIANDLLAGDVTIGIILPLQGQRAPEGRALLAAAQLALEEENGAGLLPDGRKLALAARDEAGPWGQASSEIVRLIEQDHALALITSADGSIAHQAEQIANKMGVPILTLSSDPTTTEINIPWLFRLGPSDTGQSLAFAEHIYHQNKFQRVLQVVEIDHDGRIGSVEFEKAARQLRAALPDRLDIGFSESDLETVPAQIKARNPEALVLWADANFAAKLLALIRGVAPSVQVYVCSKAAQFAIEIDGEPSDVTPALENPRDAGVWMIVSRTSGRDAAQRKFAERFERRTGTPPGVAAFQAYDAVHVVAAALRRVGPNQTRLRDQLASGMAFQGATGAISFDAAGNRVEDLSIVRIASLTELASLLP